MVAKAHIAPIQSSLTQHQYVCKLVLFKNSGERKIGYEKYQENKREREVKEE